MNETDYTNSYLLTAGECNPEHELSVSMIADKIIEVATEHANLLGVGYADLIKHGQAWVLGRLSIEMAENPQVNTDYSLTTWIASTNRRFSERNFQLSDTESGRSYGYARSIWMAIDINKRTAGDISRFTQLNDLISGHPCPIEGIPHLRPLTGQTRCSSYTFRYCDCDYNRHVNSVRYIDLILNQWPLEFHDANRTRRLDICYQHESHCGDVAEIVLEETADDNGVLTAECEIRVGSTACVRARIVFTPRERN